MTTSANVTYYDVYKDGKWVKDFSQHHYCKSINLKEKLAEFQPPEAYTIQRRYPDEDEVDHRSNPLNLKLFLEGAQFTEEEDRMPADDTAVAEAKIENLLSKANELCDLVMQLQEKLAETKAKLERSTEAINNLVNDRTAKLLELNVCARELATERETVVKLQKCVYLQTTCAVCGATLLVDNDTAPHCEDCMVTEEAQEEYDAARKEAGI